MILSRVGPVGRAEYQHGLILAAHMAPAAAARLLSNALAAVERAAAG